MLTNESHKILLQWAVADGESKLRADKRTDGNCNVKWCFQKTNLWYYQFFKKRQKEKHSATNLGGCSVLNAIELLQKKNLLKNTPTKVGDSYYLVSENNSTAVTADTNNMESTSQEESYSNWENNKTKGNVHSNHKRIWMFRWNNEQHVAGWIFYIKELCY